MDYKHTCDTIFAHFQGITNHIYGFGRPFFAPSFFLPVHHISTRPYSFLPVIMAGGLVSTYKSMMGANLFFAWVVSASVSVIFHHHLCLQLVFKLIPVAFVVHSS